MSIQNVYIEAAYLLNQILNARIFSDDYYVNEKTDIQLDDAFDAICEVEYYLKATKEEFICMRKIDSLFDKIYKPLKKASKKDEQSELVMECIFYIHSCIPSRKALILLKETDMSKIDFEEYSESESEMSESSSSDDDTDDEEITSSSESESDEELDISIENLTELHHYITCLADAKIFDKQIDDIVKGSDDVTVSGILSEVQDELLECIVILSKYLNHKIDDYAEVEEMLEDIIEDLELCHESVGKKHKEQIYLLKEKIEWIYETMFKMTNNDAVEERFEFFDLSGIKMRR